MGENATEIFERLSRIEQGVAWEAANLPPDLAALRALQRLAATTQTVTVVTGP